MRAQNSTDQENGFVDPTNLIPALFLLAGAWPWRLVSCSAGVQWWLRCWRLWSLTALWMRWSAAAGLTGA